MPLASTNTIVLTITQDTTLDVQKAVGKTGNSGFYCIDYAIENPISSTTAVQLFGQKTLNPGDPMLSFGGYQGFEKKDLIPITFTGGTGLIFVYITAVTDSKY